VKPGVAVSVGVPCVLKTPRTISFACAVAGVTPPVSVFVLPLAVADTSKAGAGAIPLKSYAIPNQVVIAVAP